MGQDSTAITQSSGYNDGWATISPYSQSPYDGSPMTEYSGFGTFVPPGVHSDSMPRMPQQGGHQHQHQMMHHSATPMGHHQLPMLNTTWPSQLTNPTPSSGSFSAPATSIPPVPRIPRAIDTPKLPSQADKGRKTLTTEQKRAMCQYHEENPGTRQADIGLRFGVERSTVSKVLRHKDQYLRRDQDPDPAALKRSGKAKNPDFDRTLSNYVRRQQQRGFDIKDEEIMEQARLFAHASGNQDAILGSLTSGWLQKFKQKHGIGTSRLSRRASETNIADSTRMPEHNLVRNGATSNDISPASPTQPLSPLSGSRSDEEVKREQNIDYDFAYRQQHSQPTTSLATDIRDNPGSSFSGGTLSPTGTFNFSPDPNAGSFQPLGMRAEMPPEFHREKRSNTFPSIDVSYGNQATPATEPMTPQLPAPTTAPSSALDSPTNDGQIAHFSINTGLTSPPALHRTSSSSSIAARSSSISLTNTGASMTPVDSSPVSPSQEDARRAANTLLSYLHNMSSTGQLFQGDYQAMLQLTKKLEIHQHQSNRPSAGGLSRIPEGDNEMNAAGPAMMQAS
ncbi:centromere binding protein B [Metarhizium brunneum]